MGRGGREVDEREREGGGRDGVEEVRSVEEGYHRSRC